MESKGYFLWQTLFTIASVIFSAGVLYANQISQGRRIKRIEDILDSLVTAYLKEPHLPKWDGQDRRKPMDVGAS